MLAAFLMKSVTLQNRSRPSLPHDWPRASGIASLLQLEWPTNRLTDQESCLFSCFLPPLVFFCSRFCSRRLRRIRHALKFQCGKKQFKQQTITREIINDERYLHILVYEAERVSRTRHHQRKDPARARSSPSWATRSIL